jgi:NADH-quinone oxidoreductase subunit L
MFLTFWGKPRWAASEHIQHAIAHPANHDHPDDETAGHEPRVDDPGAPGIATGTGGYHPHESPWTMLVPLGLLSIGAVFAGFLYHEAFVGAEEGARFWAGSLAFNEHLMHAIHDVPLWVKLSPAVVMLLGLAIAFQAYIRDTTLPERFASHARVLYAFLLNKWYFDEIYDFLFVRPGFWIGRFFWKKGDEGTIDRFGPDGAAALIVGGTKLTTRFQSGYLYTYALVMFLGLAAAATWAMTR